MAKLHGGAQVTGHGGGRISGPKSGLTLVLKNGESEALCTHLGPAHVNANLDMAIIVLWSL